MRGFPSSKDSKIKSSIEAIGLSSRWVVSCSVALALIFNRDVKTVNFVAGAILNALIGKILKKIIREERPDNTIKMDHGMPSSHAMSLFFIGSFILGKLHEETPKWWPIPVTLSVFIIFSYVSIARVAAGFHSKEQIYVGALFGLINGLLWKVACSNSGFGFNEHLENNLGLQNNQKVDMYLVVVLLLTAFFMVGLKGQLMRLLGNTQFSIGDVQSPCKIVT